MYLLNNDKSMFDAMLINNLRKVHKVFEYGTLVYNLRNKLLHLNIRMQF